MRKALSVLSVLLFHGIPLVTSQQPPRNSTALPIGSCTPTIPCSNGACCNGQTGFCGFGPPFCTPVAAGGTCTSNCDAKAECGPNAPPQNVTCPLNVCCSQFDFCGTTEDFCEVGCQSNCDPPVQLSCGPDQQTALQKRIGYYESWAITRPCDAYTPEQISAETLTHVNFAFALISDTFEIVEMTPGDQSLWLRTTQLKERNPALKVYLSIGGWTFNDPPTSTIFSQLAASADNTQTFINSALNILQAFAFDGLDIDWEYPGAYDRGGNPDDTANYVTFMARVKNAFAPRGYGLTFTAPSSYWYLQHFDLPSLLTHADWVNIMTYDLHGTWDGTDPFIGPIVLAHTNLTEIKQTMQLFRNVGINPEKMVMGIGFYGRSFQLDDPSCSEPGCGFSGPASAGPCSANPGTLMFAEIEDIINSNNLQPILDDEAAVNYIVWNDNQWVSYDDATTLQMKINYANSICLGGTMIWSVDQDDTSYTALSGLYDFIPNNTAREVVTGNQCVITDCGKGCPSIEYTALTKVYTNPSTGKICTTDNLATLCCPSGDAPQHCTWRGGGAPTCNPQCEVGEITIASDPIIGAGHPICIQGFMSFCCQSGIPDPLGCIVGECGETSCTNDRVVQTFVKQGNAGGSCAGPTSTQTCPDVCPDSNGKPLCCHADWGYTNCSWVGDLPYCGNAACPVGQVSVFTDSQGDAPTACLGLATRSYCCNPPSDISFLPVPENWVFPLVSPVGGNVYSVDQPATFTVDFDEPVDTLSQDENDTPFGEVFISSPNPAAVSSMSLESDWVITGCSRSSDQPQQVLAYCSKPMDDEESGCGHVFIGQAEHTIIKMPTTCGLGPYARIASLDVHPNQTILSGTLHQAQIPSNEKIFALNFDYNFAEIPESNGPVLMRADLTNIDGYWDDIIDSPPDLGVVATKRKRDFHQPEELERRWFGSFDLWLKKVTTLTASDSLVRNYRSSFDYPLFHQEEACPHFTSSLDISVTGNAVASSTFGYYLEATVVPPAVQEAYVYVRTSASAQATFSVTGMAGVNFDSAKTTLATLGFPGLHYPGLLTLGPNLVLYGQFVGQLSMSGQLSSTVQYQFPSLDFSFGKMDKNPDEENFGPPITPSKIVNGYNYNFGYNVNLEGKAQLHLVPSFQLGVNVLNGQLLDAQIYVEADMFGGVGINGSVSQSVSPTFCVQPHYGLNVHGGLTGNILYWRTVPLDVIFFENEFDFGGACYSSVAEPPVDGTDTNMRREIESSNTMSQDEQELRITGSAYQGEPRSIEGGSSDTDHIVHFISPIEEEKRIVKRVPFLPGSLFCPQSDDDITSSQNGTDCQCYDDFDQDDPFGTDLLSRRALDNDTVSTPLHTLASESSLRTCTNIKVPIPAYQKTPIVSYYDLANPTTLDPTYASYIPTVPINLGTNAAGRPFLSIGNKPVYAREHPYEVSMAPLFIDFLQQDTDLWQNAAGNQNWCTWVQTNLEAVPTYVTPLFGGTSMFTQIATCYPADSRATPMVILEQIANVVKNQAFSSTEVILNRIDQAPPSIRNANTFRTYCPKKQISVLRSAAAVPSFLNSPPVRDIFLSMNTCVKDAWIAWYNAYLNANVDAPNRANFNLPNEYDNWVHAIVANTPTFLRNQIQGLISLFNANNPAGNSVNVDLSWAVLLDEITLNLAGQPLAPPTTQYAVGVPVSRNDLTADIHAAIQDINWINQLPIH